MKRWLVLLLIITLLAPAASPAAMEKSELSESGSAKAQSRGVDQDLSAMGAETWWRIGVMSMHVSEILKTSRDILARGNLNADGQKQLAQVLDKLHVLVPVGFYPKENKTISDIIDGLNELEAALEKLQGKPQGK